MLFVSGKEKDLGFSVVSASGGGRELLPALRCEWRREFSEAGGLQNALTVSVILVISVLPLSTSKSFLWLRAEKEAGLWGTQTFGDLSSSLNFRGAWAVSPQAVALLHWSCRTATVAAGWISTIQFLIVCVCLFLCAQTTFFNSLIKGGTVSCTTCSQKNSKYYILIDSSMLQQRKL